MIKVYISSDYSVIALWSITLLTETYSPNEFGVKRLLGLHIYFHYEEDDDESMYLKFY